MKSQRLHSLDALRGIMMLLGIVLHAAASFVVYPIEELWPYKFRVTDVYFDATLTIIHLFRIPVFYIIAGYFMTMILEKYDVKTVIKKRFRRIVLPFTFGMLVLMPIITFAFYLLITKTDTVSWQALEMYWSVTYWTTVHFWFLYYLIFFYVIHILYHRYFRQYLEKVAIKTTALFIVVFMAQILLLILFGNDSIHGDYSMLPPLGAVLYFMTYYFLGLHLYTHFEKFLKMTAFSWKKIGVSIFFTTIYLLFRDVEENLGPEIYWQLIESVLTIMAATTLVVAVFGVFTKLFEQPKWWIKFIAKSSYTIYMVHLPIMVWLVYFLKDEMQNPFLFYITLITLTTGIAFSIYFIKNILLYFKNLYIYHTK